LKLVSKFSQEHNITYALVESVPLYAYRGRNLGPC